MKQTVLNVCYNIILMLESLFVWQLCFLNKPLYFINKIYFHTHLEWGGDAPSRPPVAPALQWQHHSSQRHQQDQEKAKVWELTARNFRSHLPSTGWAISGLLDCSTEWPFGGCEASYPSRWHPSPILHTSIQKNEIPQTPQHNPQKTSILWKVWPSCWSNESKLQALNADVM